MPSDLSPWRLAVACHYHPTSNSLRRVQVFLQEGAFPSNIEGGPDDVNEIRVDVMWGRTYEASVCALACSALCAIGSTLAAPTL
jgi:hypothetical protein